VDDSPTARLRGGDAKQGPDGISGAPMVEAEDRFVEIGGAYGAVHDMY
jgi:hypothetical protein